MGLRELGWFFRLVASPEPERDRFFHTPQGREEEKVRKGLKRTAGREERAQQTPETLIRSYRIPRRSPAFKI